MPQVAFTTLFDWVTAVSMFDAILQDPNTRELGLAFSEHPDFRLLTRHELLPYQGSKQVPPAAEFSRSVYSFHGFIESLGTKRVLSRQGPLLQYFGLQPGSQGFRTWYTRDDLSTVVLGLTRIESKESCSQFLSPGAIINWKNQMAPDFRQSPIFEFDEVWRVLCYELAVRPGRFRLSAG